ncbi:MAG TPA: hypothetical protein VFC53_11545 [Dehalococcoidia bacterium]|nr:hypothetical protein [Dehalococcoidia bacterium]
MTQDGTLTAPCPKCNGTGEIELKMALLFGRGANFYRHGRYATAGGVRKVAAPGLKASATCQTCGGSGRVAS